MEEDSSNISPIKAIHDIARRNKLRIEYKLEKESGPAHAKIYTVRLYFGEKEYIGNDRSIKLAQRSAAQIALNDSKHLLSINNSQETKLFQSPTVALNTWAAQHHIPTQYILLNEEYLIPSPKSRIMFFYRVYIGNDLYFDGYGISHQQARINCARQALNFIHQNQITTLPSTSSENQPKSKISLMYERAKKLGLSVQMEQPEPLTIIYHIGESYTSTATSTTKNQAKQLAAEKMLEILPLSEENEKHKHNRKHSNQHKKFIEQKGSNNYSLSENINPITRLYQIAQARQVKIEFIEKENSSKDKGFHYHVKLDENLFADGYGQNKQAAKRSAAENLLIKLNFDMSTSSFSLSPPPPPPPPPSAPTKSLLKRDENLKKQQEKKRVHFIEDETNSSLITKQELINQCEKFDIITQYNDKMIKPHQYESILSLLKDNQLLAQFRGNASSLIHAQENVSSIAWNNLQDLFNSSNQITIN